MVFSEIKLITVTGRVWCVAAVLVSTALFVHSAYGQGTAFDYQGQLLNNGQPATGNYVAIPLKAFLALQCCLPHSILGIWWMSIILLATSSSHSSSEGMVTAAFLA